jgi:hypothetical protein
VPRALGAGTIGAGAAALAAAGAADALAGGEPLVDAENASARRIDE